MKFMHLSDLHLGKRVNEFSMLEDQTYILKQILSILDREALDAVLITGDIYDKSIPPVEAVELLDKFLIELAKRKLPVLIISGNHDSPERLAFASGLIADSQVYISPVYNGTVTCVTLQDQYGPVNFYLLPFLKPIHVRRAFPEESIESYTDALDCAIRNMKINPEQRNILLTHQFVTGSTRCESEEISVGGLDQVDLRAFSLFDYVALGHLHGPQNLDGDRVRYCGTPLKYSFSETKHQKSVTIVLLEAKNTRHVSQIPLIPRRDMLELRGSYLELTSPNFYRKFDREAYLHITLIDEDDIPDAISKLRLIYPNLMRLDYDNQRTRNHIQTLIQADANAQSSPLDLFAEFYKQRNHQDLSPEQREYLTGLIQDIWEE